MFLPYENSIYSKMNFVKIGLYWLYDDEGTITNPTFRSLYSSIFFSEILKKPRIILIFWTFPCLFNVIIFWLQFMVSYNAFLQLISVPIWHGGWCVHLSESVAMFHCVFGDLKVWIPWLLNFRVTSQICWWSKPGLFYSFCKLLSLVSF